MIVEASQPLLPTSLSGAFLFRGLENHLDHETSQIKGVQKSGPASQLSSPQSPPLRLILPLPDWSPPVYCWKQAAPKNFGVFFRFRSVYGLPLSSWYPRDYQWPACVHICSKLFEPCQQGSLSRFPAWKRPERFHLSKAEPVEPASWAHTATEKNTHHLVGMFLECSTWIEGAPSLDWILWTGKSPLGM